MKLLLALACLCCAAYSLGAQPLKLCYEDQDVYPWSLKDGTGLNHDIIKQLAAKNQLSVQLTALPWKRCLYEVAQGRYDGFFSASHTPERAQWAAYPLLDGSELPDPKYRLNKDRYVLFHHKGDGLQWDGQQLLGLRGRTAIGVQRGYSIAAELKAQGLPFDDSSASAADLFRKLDAGLLAAMMTLEHEGHKTLASLPESQQAKIEQFPLPYRTRYLYLVFAKTFAASNPQLVRQLWDDVYLLRESPAYVQKAKQLGAQP